MRVLQQCLRNSRGEAMAEFGLLLALIAVVAMGAITLLGHSMGAGAPGIATELRF